ncbi:MAG: hypothetical protein QOF21_1957, partial [Actinomycetota bacterium]
VNLIGNLVFMHRFGAIAAAWSSVAGYGVAAAITAVGTQTARRSTLPTVSLLIRCAAITGGTAGAIYVTRAEWLVSVGVGASVYAAATLIVFRRESTRLRDMLTRLVDARRASDAT